MGAQVNKPHYVQTQRGLFGHKYCIWRGRVRLVEVETVTEANWLAEKLNEAFMAGVNAAALAASGTRPTLFESVVGHDNGNNGIG